MKLGKNKVFFLVIFLTFSIQKLPAEDKILSAPLLNLEKLKPSFEEIDQTNSDEINNEVILNTKNKNNVNKNSSTVKLIGLDKITAKTSEISLGLGEIKKFGPLEIKVLKCSKINSNNSIGSVAYLQVKDLSVNQNEKVFIFNGWTFSSDPTIAPFDHAIYDLQLIDCNNT
jgi:hypothetical protein